MQTQNYRKPFAILSSLFFLWGFITVMNDLLNNTFLEMFKLSKTESSLVQVFFFIGYFVIAGIYFVISSRGKDPINRIGYKNAMSLGLFVAGIGCLLFYPASRLHSFPFFLACLFVLSAGITILQIAANPFATLMGSPEKSSMRLNLAQGLNSLGTTLGPIVGTLLIFSVFSSGKATPESLAKTYILYGCVFIFFAVLTLKSTLPDYRNESSRIDRKVLFSNRNLMLGIVAIFCYVGAEVSVGNWLGKLMQEPEIGGLELENANRYLAFYWGGLMIGRLCGSLAMSSVRYRNLYNLFLPIVIFLFIYFITSFKHNGDSYYFEFRTITDFHYYIYGLILFYVSLLFTKGRTAQSLTLFAVINTVLLLIGMLVKHELAMWAVLSVGLFCSIMWSNTFSLAIKDLGAYTSVGSSLLIMAVVGGAVFPVCQGYLADHVSIQFSFLVPIVGFVYLIVYGLLSSKSESRS